MAANKPPLPVFVVDLFGLDHAVCFLAPGVTHLVVDGRADVGLAAVVVVVDFLVLVAMTDF